MSYCAECGAEVADEAASCPECGAAVGEGDRSDRLALLLIVLNLIGLVAISTVLGAAVFYLQAGAVGGAYNSASVSTSFVVGLLSILLGWASGYTWAQSG